jgi:SagB-type dehydrogenase family enzyme
MTFLTSINPVAGAAAIMLSMVASVASASTSAVTLPWPRRESGYSLERALVERRSMREFDGTPLSLGELAQLAWAAQGEVASGRRTTPSAGALYPLELYIVAGNVKDLAAGVYRYEPSRHRLAPVAEGDRRRRLADAALGQRWLAQAPLVFVIAAVERRTTAKYGQRGVRYVYMEAGHAAQNVLVQARAHELDAVPVGAFSDAEVHAAAALPGDARPLYLVPVGRARTTAR